MNDQLFFARKCKCGQICRIIVDPSECMETKCAGGMWHEKPAMALDLKYHVLLQFQQHTFDLPRTRFTFDSCCLPVNPTYVDHPEYPGLCAFYVRCAICNRAMDTMKFMKIDYKEEKAA